MINLSKYLSFIICIHHISLNVGALFGSKDSFTEFSKINSIETEKWIQTKWLNPNIKVGQIGGISVDRDNLIYLFHRCDRVWSMNSFNVDNIFSERHLGPIKSSTIIVVTPNGTIINQWGSHIFYLPHGITVDNDKNVWLTDVALHQVLKFSKSSFTTPILSIGIAFVPGSDSAHLCKPTSIAVSNNGDFFVADGYCNSRILKFNSLGEKILEWGRHTITVGYRMPTQGEFLIPHALALADDLNLICVADRENGRIQCFNSKNANFAFILKSVHIGPRIFSVAYCKSKGLFFLINGESYLSNIPVQGFIMYANNTIVGTFGHNLKNPHDIALSTNCENIYVGEIDPYAAWKYQSNNLSSIEEISSTYPKSSASTAKNKFLQNDGEIEGLAGAVMVTGACLIFAASLLIAALIYSRSKRTGCGHCSSNKWLTNGKVEGFKLGNILGHKGFEKLNTTEGSDEEQPLA